MKTVLKILNNEVINSQVVYEDMSLLDPDYLWVDITNLEVKPGRGWKFFNATEGMNLDYTWELKVVAPEGYFYDKKPAEQAE